MFSLQQIQAPQPQTVRAQSTHLSYDAVHKRVCVCLGRSVFVAPILGGNSGTLQFSKHIAPVTAAAFAPSGNYVASGDEAGNVKIWDASSGDVGDELTVKSEFQVLGGPIRAIAWDGEGQRLVAVGAGQDKFGHCFSWDSGNSVGEISGHSDEILDVSIKPQRPYRAATAGVDKSVVLFAGPPFKFVRSARDNHQNIVRCVQFSPDGRYFVSGGADKRLVVYDGKSGDVVTTIEAHDMGIFGISWYPDSSKFVSCSADGSAKVWAADSWTLVETHTLGSTVDAQLVGVAVTDAGILAVSLNGDFNYFGETLTVVKGHQSAISASAVVGSALYTGGTDGQLYEWAVDGKLVPGPQAVGDSKTRHANYVADIAAVGDYIVTVGWDDVLKVWHHRKLVSETKLGAQPKKLVQTGPHTVAVLFETSVETYSVAGGQVAAASSSKLAYESNDVDFLADQLLATNLSANKIEPLDAAKLEAATSSFSAIRAAPALIRVSPDNKYIALGDNTGKYVVYNSADNSVKTTRWVFHSSKVLDARWSPDSRFLLSGGLDTTLLVYSVEKLTKVGKHPLSHQTGISRVEWLRYDFEGSGTATVLTAGLDGALKVWELDLNQYK